MDNPGKYKSDTKDECRDRQDPLNHKNPAEKMPLQQSHQASSQAAKAGKREVTQTKNPTEDKPRKDKPKEDKPKRDKPGKTEVAPKQDCQMAVEAGAKGLAENYPTVVDMEKQVTPTSQKFGLKWDEITFEKRLEEASRSLEASCGDSEIKEGKPTALENKEALDDFMAQLDEITEELEDMIKDF